MKQVIAIIVLFLFHTIIQHIIITANNLHCHHHDEESDCVSKVIFGRLSPDVTTHHCVAQIHVIIMAHNLIMMMMVMMLMFKIYIVDWSPSS